MRIFHIFCLISLFTFALSFGQFPNSFTQLSKNTNYGFAFDVAISPEGIIFVANCQGSILAYKKVVDGYEFKASIDEGGIAYALEYGPDNILYVAYGEDGFIAYQFEEDNFIKVDSENLEGIAVDVEVDLDGIIYVACIDSGIYAFENEGGIISKKAHSKVVGNAYKISVTNDSIVFLANGQSGLSALKYLGESFEKTSTISFEGGIEVIDVSNDLNGSVFISNAENGLFSLKFDGNKFSKTDSVSKHTRFCTYVGDGYLYSIHFLWDSYSFRYFLEAYKYINDSLKFITTTEIVLNYPGFPRSISIGSDNQIFASCDMGGVLEFNFNESTFTQVGRLEYSGYARGVSISNDGTIFLANAYDGLRAYKKYNTDLICVGHIDSGGVAYDVEVDENGIIFLANYVDCLRVFTFNGESFVNIAHYNDPQLGAQIYANKISIRSDGTIFLAASTANGNAKRGVYAFKYADSAIVKITDTDIMKSAMDVEMYSDKTIITANNGNGLAAFNYNDTVFTLITNIDNGGVARDVAIGPDSTIYLANELDGLRAYKFDGNTLLNIGHINDGSHALGVDVGPDGTIFLANDEDGIRAYSFDGSHFENKAHYYETNELVYNSYFEHEFHTNNVYVSSLGTVFLSHSFEGLTEFSYSGYSDINVRNSNFPYNYSLIQNYPNPFNPSTTIQYQLPKSSNVEITIFNLLGQQIWKKQFNRQTAGHHEIKINLSNKSSGIYFYRLDAGDFVQTKKMVLLK